MNAVVPPVGSRTRRARRPQAQLLFRSATSHVYALAHGITPELAADRLYRPDVTLAAYLRVQKAAVDPAVTTLPEWAGNLARETWAEFVGLLGPESAYAQLSARGQSATFSAGKVRFPARNATPTLAGDFVGEREPIPVRKGSVLAPSLTPKKLGVITVYSRELGQGSGASIEAFLRGAIVEDTAPVIDARLLDSNAATAVRPAGLLNGVTLTPSAGTTAADIVADLKAAISPILLAGGGRRVVLLMNPLQALSLSLQTDAAGALVWPDAARKVATAEPIVSNNVPVGTIIAVDAAEFVTAADDAPTFVVSSEALLHMDDAPDPITDGTMASPVVSLYQQDALAIKMVQLMNWTMRRPGMVAGVSGIAW